MLFQMVMDLSSYRWEFGTVQPTVDKGRAGQIKHQKVSLYKQVIQPIQNRLKKIVKRGAACQN